MAEQLILIVEDDEDQQRILADTLSYHGFRVLQARDGLDAMQRIEESIPDLIILDVRLPHIDGFSLAEILKKDPKTARIPVLAVTLYDVDIRQRDSAPWDKLRMKPIAPADLIAEVRALLARDGEAAGGEGGLRPA